MHEAQKCLNLCNLGCHHVSNMVTLLTLIVLLVGPKRIAAAYKAYLWAGDMLHFENGARPCRLRSLWI